MAQDSRNDLQTNPGDGFRRQIARTATAQGFFSIWMTVFADDPAMRRLLIKEFTGTAADCFDTVTTQPIRPRPATDLAHGSKT
jgi:hypothetical protein